MTSIDSTVDSTVPRGASERQAGGLRPALDAIPPHCHDRPLGRGVRLVARATGVYAAAVAALLVFDAWYLVVPLWILAGLAIAGLFVVGHDAAHGALFESAALNRRVARWCMVPSLHVEQAWELGHNRIHHGHTLRQGMDFVWHPLTPEEYRALPRWQRWRHRFEWSALGAGAYYGREVWWNKMITFTPPERYRDGIRRDKRFLAVVAGAVFVALVGLAWLTGGSVVAGLWTWVKVFAVPFALFTWLIGFTVYLHHIAPDIKWWPRREWTSVRGQVEGTTVIDVPRWLNALFFHNIFVHVPHHVDMRIPCYSLPAAAEAIAEAMPGEVRERPFRWRDYLESTRRCKVYDFDAKRWLTYRDVAA